MKIGTSHFRSVILLAVAVGLLSMTGCRATPGRLQKWADRPGSEEMFIKALKNPKNHDDARETALFLLVKQWRYSSDMMRKDVVKALPEDQRIRIVAGTLPKIAKYYHGADKTARIQTRDAVYQIRKQITDPKNKAAIDDIITDWLQNYWTEAPCVKQIGSTRAQGLFNAIGKEAGSKILVTILDEGNWKNSYCALINTDGVSWRDDSKKVASAMLGFWDRGLVPDDFATGQVPFFDELSTFSKLPVVREWGFKKIRDEKISTQTRGLIIAVLSRSITESDVPHYVKMLNNTDLYRWEGVHELIVIKGAEGLDLALNKLPEDTANATESGYSYDAKTSTHRRDGFQRSAKYICQLEKMQEDADAMVPVLIKHAKKTDGLIFARALATYCLGFVGNEATLDVLKNLKSLATSADVVPFWSLEGSESAGAVPLTQVIDDTIEQLHKTIEKRAQKAKAAGNDADNKTDAAEGDAAEGDAAEGDAAEGDAAEGDAN